MPVNLLSAISSLFLRGYSLVGDYIEHLRWLSPVQPPVNPGDNHAHWFARVAAIKKRQRAFGLIDDLKGWVERHGYKRPVDALPA
jgi:hypothetical protein